MVALRAPVGGQRCATNRSSGTGIERPEKVRLVRGLLGSKGFRLEVLFFQLPPPVSLRAPARSRNAERASSQVSLSLVRGVVTGHWLDTEGNEGIDALIVVEGAGAALGLLGEGIAAHAAHAALGGCCRPPPEHGLSGAAPTSLGVSPAT